MSTGPILDAITTFLRNVGIETFEAELPAGTFLPGLRIAEGRLLYDRSRLRWPGDLLHEAGHLAVAPASERASLSDDATASAEMSDEEEAASIAWSYAAVMALGLDPALLFHEGGYKGRSQALLQGYGMGVYTGVAGLKAFGMTTYGPEAADLGAAPYPHMLHWLRG